MDNPVTGKVVSPADEEELGQSIDQGLCFHGRLNGQPIGLIAGLEQDYCGLKAPQPARGLTSTSNFFPPEPDVFYDIREGISGSETV